jgi:hypothetical protein
MRPGMLPAFTGIACHHAWKPHDSYDGVAGHALCGAHLLRELIAMTETGTADDVIWAQQAIDGLLARKKAAGSARDAGRGTMDAEVLDKQSRWFPRAGRCRDRPERRPPQQAAQETERPRNPDALMRDRADDYLRFARDQQVPIRHQPSRAGHQDEQARIKVSGCMRPTAGAEFSAPSGLTPPPPPATASAPSTPSPTPPRATPGSPSQPDTETLPVNRFPAHVRNYKIRQTYPVTMTHKAWSCSGRNISEASQAHDRHIVRVVGVMAWGRRFGRAKRRQPHTPVPCRTACAIGCPGRFLKRSATSWRLLFEDYHLICETPAGPSWAMPGLPSGSH